MKAHISSGWHCGCPSERSPLGHRPRGRRTFPDSPIRLPTEFVHFLISFISCIKLLTAYATLGNIKLI